MARVFQSLLFVLAFIAAGESGAQVKIHDMAVKLLAKPYGIEKRIELESVDGLHCASDGTKHLAFTLRSSGVKEVVLRHPSFSLDITLPNKGWASIGSLSGCSITFPVTGDSRKESRSYVASFKSDLSPSDLESYLRQAAASGARVRLLGQADMAVGSNGKSEFSKKNLKLELTARTILSGKFKSVIYSSADKLPKVGCR
ncbi:hypothetical protein [Haloferula sp.]|uniref:hypothetical protein n=1 Tax=Haloferula sp. TaxID=2497595 RepID=UPI00329EC0A3